jgi:hypothetical protein
MNNNRFTSNYRRRLKILGFSLPLLITFSVVSTRPTLACKAEAGSKPATLAQRVNTAPYIFDGTVTKVTGHMLTIKVDRYFKGFGSKIVQLTGFNQSSCDEFITKTGEHYLFFAEAKNQQPWIAVYDGPFGSTRSWTNTTLTDLKKLGLVGRTKQR